MVLSTPFFCPSADSDGDYQESIEFDRQRKKQIIVTHLGVVRTDDVGI